MILFRTCWHRNFILLVLVCVCWNGSVARQKAREHEQNEPSTQSTPRVSANATTATTTTPKEQGLELEQPHKTSGNFSAYWLTIKCESHMFCAVYPLTLQKLSIESCSDACLMPCLELAAREISCWSFCVLFLGRHTQSRMSRNPDSQICVEWLLHE